MSAARVCKEQSDYVKCSRASRDSCSSPQQLRLSRCLRTCCRLLGACEWVALRPRLRCLLLLEDGRLASEHCPSACASARLPTAPPIDLPVYYIALRSAPRRAAVLEPQLARVARARDVRRVEAVTADEALAMMLDGRLVIDGSPPSRAVALKLRFGVACTLSHLRVYRMAVHDGHDQVLVLEDDVSLRSALLWPSSLREMSAASSAPDRWDVLQLVSNAPNAYATQEKSGVSGLGGGRHAWRQWHTDATFGSAAYVIQLRAMRRLLSATTPDGNVTWLTRSTVNGRTVDTVDSDRTLFGRVTVYTRRWPLVTFQISSGGASTLNHSKFADAQVNAIAASALEGGEDGVAGGAGLLD